jgi:glycosyltransferase involved in cell wall biosynthesis
VNIAFVLPYLAERFGGPVTVAKGLGQRLKAEGQNVSYWAPGEWEDRRELASLEDVHVYDLDWPRRWHRSKDLSRYLIEGISSIDLVHINGFWLHPTYAASRLACVSNIPYIFCPAGALEPWALKRRRLKWFKKAIYLKLIGESTMKHAACLHACSLKEAEQFRNVGYAGPVTIIPNGINTDQYAPGDPTEAEAYWPDLKDRSTVVFMSRLSPEKGLNMLIPAWAELIRSGSHRDAILVIAGPDNRGHLRIVEEMIDKYNLRTHVLITGMVQGKKKLAILRRADVFVLPSYSENFGIVVAEALACGTPVITTTGTPWQELETVGAGRWISPTKDQIRIALYDLLDMSESQRQQMGQRGTALVHERYTWDQAASKFLTVCKAVLDGKSIPLHPDLTPMEG